jgi:ammonia channel protein AmtB
LERQLFLLLLVSEEEEIKGLDVCEHEMSAYADSPAEQMAGFKM